MARYTKVKRVEYKGKQAYSNVRYPDIPLSADDYYVYTSIGDRFDTLAVEFYDDSSLWWIIAAANPKYGFGTLLPPLGAQIRIPSNPNPIIQQFTLINQ